MSNKLSHPGKRFQGQFIDGLITMAILGVSVYMLRSLGLSGDIASYLPILLAASYYLFSDAFPKGQSLGKKILGMSVIHKENGKYCNILQSFLRNFLTPMLGIIDVLLIFGENRQRVGDLLATTIVVEVKS